MNVAHWFHIYAAGDWREPVAEHMAALADSGFDGEFHVGIVGPPENVDEVRAELAAIRPPNTWVCAPVGWEQVTLHALHEHAQSFDGAILYAHTKGAHDPSTVNIAWRRSMSWHLVKGWRPAAEALDHGYAAVGCHWLTVEEFGRPDGVPLPCFGGNYWLARSDYVRQLAPCADSCRHDAEGWIGTGAPRVLDLCPGWPGNFSPVKYGRLIAGR